MTEESKETLEKIRDPLITNRIFHVNVEGEELEQVPIQYVRIDEDTKTGIIDADPKVDNNS